MMRQAMIRGREQGDRMKDGLARQSTHPMQLVKMAPFTSGDQIWDTRSSYN
jgi:hypothetical protein